MVPIKKVAESKAMKWYLGTKFHKTWVMLWDKYPLLMQLPLAMVMCFVMEWLSRHSFLEAWGFVIEHTGPFLFNSYCIFAVYSIVFISRRQDFWRLLVTFFFTVLGVTNCIVLLNRVSPFGYTDLSMVSDLLTMQDSQYFTAEQAMLVVIALIFAIALMIVIAVKVPKKPKRKPLWLRIVVCLALLGSLYPATVFCRSAGIMTSYFGNLAQGYLDYGYLYGFASSVFDRGMSRPFGYSESKIDSILEEDSNLGENTIDEENMPNIVVILLESMYDVSECSFLETSEDPIPYLHYLEENYSTGHCIVPVVGAGTCNSEFEVLTGMSVNFFGPGEYPQKTILKETDTESYADVLSDIGYGTHVVHNNGGNFYSRANAFSMMGFDTFTCKELLDITEYTPLGSWPTDDILIQPTLDSMASTEGPDFIYTITVEAHGSYPEYVVEEDPAITVTAEGKTEGQQNAWEYYVNRIYNVDDFIQKYIEAIDSTGEPTLVIMFGDHLPTMGLTEDEVATGSLYETKYFTWNNFGMEKEDEDLTTYELVSEYLDRLGIHNGTINAYHQTKEAEGVEAGTDDYLDDLEMLQYDILYGKRYVYDGEDGCPASDLQMGVNEVTIDSAYFFNGYLNIYGDNFTKWSKVYVNGEKVSTTYVSGQVLKIKASAVADGDTITVCQVGSSNTIFRESNEWNVVEPGLESDEELDETEEE